MRVADGRTVRGKRMKGRIRIAAVGLVAMTVAGCTVVDRAGATTVTQWNVQGNGGFVSLDLLNTLQLAGGGSEADASSAPARRGLGHRRLPLDGGRRRNPCPTSADVVASGVAPRHHAGRGRERRRRDGHADRREQLHLPINTGLINVDVSCGTASAAEDASGNPTADGHREPGQRVGQPEPDQRAAAAARRLACPRRRRSASGVAGRHHRPARNTSPLSPTVHEPARARSTASCSASVSLEPDAAWPAGSDLDRRVLRPRRPARPSSARAGGSSPVLRRRHRHPRTRCSA